WQHTHLLDAFVVVHHVHKSSAHWTIVLIDYTNRHCRHFPMFIHMPYQYTIKNRCIDKEHQQHVIVEKVLKLALKKFDNLFHVLILSMVLEEQPVSLLTNHSPLHDLEALL